MKRCSKCLVEKDFIEYSKSSRNKDGKRSQCKKCDFVYRKTIDNEKINEYRKNYYIENKEKLSLLNKEYRLKNKESIKLTKIKNKDISKIKNTSRDYYLKNKEILNKKSKLYQQKNKCELIEKARLRRIERKKIDCIFKLECNIRRLIQLSLKSKGYSKDTKTFKILGCNIEEFKNHLESKFESWMTWENKGLFNSTFNHGWDLDHIIPLCSASTKEDIIKLNHYTNFQPLCGKINREIKNGNY